jgi:membrane-bound lytic murein transglycosylase D
MKQNKFLARFKQYRQPALIGSAFVAGAVCSVLVAGQLHILPGSSKGTSSAVQNTPEGTDLSLDEAVGLATATTELGESDETLADEVNEFAQDQDEEAPPAGLAVATSTPVPASPKTEIDLAYMMNLIGDITAFKGNAVETPERPIDPNADWIFDRNAVLADAEERINKDFRVPDLLKDRVGFWFDVYTKWDDNKRVVHHSRYPWIVFKVVDVAPIVNSDMPKRLWMRREKADKMAKEQANNVRKALASLAKKKAGSPLNETERMVADALFPLGGDLRKQAQRALGEVRIQVGQKNFFEGGLETSQRYLTTMESIFKKQKLPIELTRIPLVESSFNKHATSKVGATGIWQFMGNTGRKFMIVNDSIDERRSPFKASEAAARLLKENHLILRHSWPLAVTAWNHGPGGVRKAAKASASYDLGVIVKKYRSRSFDFASSNFYSEFLAALHAERYSDIAFRPFPRMEPVELEVVRLHKATRVNELLKVTGLSSDDFLLINPDLVGVAKKNLPVPIGFRVHVPAQVRASLDKGIAVADSRVK